MGKVVAFFKSPMGACLAGVVLGNILDRKTGLVTKGIDATLGKVPGLGKLVVG